MTREERIKIEHSRHERALKSIDVFWDFLGETGASISSHEPFKLPDTGEEVLWTIFDPLNMVIQYQKIRTKPGEDGFGEFRADET
jgi:hypothetical protein